MSTADEVTTDYDWLTLDDDEAVLWSSVPHRYSLVPALVIGIPLSLVLIGIPIIVSAYLWRQNTVYVVTTDALYAKSGILSRDVQRIDFGKVQNISYTQGVFGTQFGYGNVDISTAGSSGVEMQFQSIPDPKGVADRIKGRVRTGREEPADESAVLDEIVAELRAIREAIEAQEPGRPAGRAETASGPGPTSDESTSAPDDPEPTTDEPEQSDLGHDDR